MNSKRAVWRRSDSSRWMAWQVWRKGHAPFSRRSWCSGASYIWFVTPWYIPRKEWGRFTKELKGIYGAVNAKQARERFEIFRKEWAAYPGAVAVWEKNFAHVEQLFSYGSAVRKIMYATNAVESVNASFRKVTKKGAFPNEEAVFKLLYLRVLELYGKWGGRRIPNWALVRNQLLMDERIEKLMQQYDAIY